MRKHRTVSSWSLVAVLAVLATACGTDTNDDGAEQTGGTQPEHNWQFSSYLGPDGAQMQAMDWWAEEVGSRSEGRIAVETFYTEALLPATDTLPGVGQGRAQVGYTNPGGYHPGELELSTVGELPFVARNPEAVVRAYEALYDEEEGFRQQFHDQGVEVLYFVPTGGAIVGTSTSLQTVEDFSGKQIRAIGRLSEAVDRMGANTVAMSGAEIYEALERGVLDGFTSFPFEVLTDYSMHEVMSDVVDVGFGNYGVGAVVVNLDEYESLPDDLRTLVDEVSDEAIGQTLDRLSESHQRVCGVLLDAGVNVHAWPDSQVEDLQELVNVPELQDQWAQELGEVNGVDAGQFLQSYLDKVEQLAAETSYDPAVARCADGG